MFRCKARIDEHKDYMEFANQTVDHGGEMVTLTGDRTWNKLFSWRDQQRLMINDIYYNYVRNIERYAYDFNKTEHDVVYTEQIITSLDDVAESWTKYQEKDSDARSRSIKHDLVNYMQGRPGFVEV